MALSTAERVKQTFNVIALRYEAKALLTGRQWERRGELVDRCAKARQKAEELNFKRYERRVEVARKKLIDQAGSKTKEYKPYWSRNDRFDKAAILRLAQRDVRQMHERRIGRINQYETLGLTTLLGTAKRENQLHGKSERAFKNVTDRRQRNDRRAVPEQTRRQKYDQ